MKLCLPDQRHFRVTGRGREPCTLAGMTQQADALKKRTKQFAQDVIRFVRTLPDTDEGRAIGRQLLRSGPGVASNYRSACRARSRAEFVARIGIALEESDELSAIFAQSSITARTPLARSEGR